MKLETQVLSLSIALVFLLAVFVVPRSAAQQKPPQKSEMKSMEHMPMDQMMKDCMQHHQSAMKSIDEMTKMMEGANQSTDPAKMRAALDQSQKQLTEMKERMTMCHNMMGMMEKMHGMGGMMKGGSK